MTDISIRLSYNDFFSESESLETLLAKFSTDDLFRAASLLNSKVKQNQNSKETIKDWFSSLVLQKDFLKKVKSVNSHIINTYSNLTLLSYLTDCQDTAKNQDLTAFELNLFKVYLLINSEQDSKEVNISNAEDLDTKERLSASLLQLSYYSHDLSNYVLSEIFLCQLIKSIEFFKYVETNLPGHLQKFLNKYKCEDWQEWIKRLLKIIVPIFSHDDSKFSEIKLEGKDIKEIGEFLDLFGAQIYDTELPDFVKLRSNPLYSYNSGSYIVISKLFLIERIFKSLVFEFNLNINNCVDSKWKVEDFKAEFCDKFSERTLFYKVINNSFPKSKKFIKESGDNFKHIGYNNGEPDFYVRFKNKILLFESKDVVLKGEEKQSRNYKVLKKALESKFLFTTKGEKRQNKAILQIINNIKRIFDKYYDKVDNSYKTEFIKIYPFLVTHDRQFDSPELNRLLNRWFRAELQKKFNIEERNRIHNLTVLNIDSLILNQETLRSRGKNGLENLVEQYENYVRIKPTTNIELINQQYLDTSLSFYTFLGMHFDKMKRDSPNFIDEYLKYLDIE